MTQASLLKPVADWLLQHVGEIFGWLRPLFRRRPLKIVVDDKNTRWMCIASVRGVPAMQVVSDWFVSNPTDGGVRIVKAHLVRRLPPQGWSLRGKKQTTYASTVDVEVGSRHIGDMVPPKTAGDLRALFFVTQPVQEGTTFHAVTTFVDHLDHKYTKKTTYPASAAPLMERQC